MNPATAPAASVQAITASISMPGAHHPSRHQFPLESLGLVAQPTLPSIEIPDGPEPGCTNRRQSVPDAAMAWA